MFCQGGKRVLKRYTDTASFSATRVAFMSITDGLNVTVSKMFFLSPTKGFPGFSSSFELITTIETATATMTIMPFAAQGDAIYVFKMQK